ncbi:Protein GrpE [Marinomonas aquimarina]|uniref:Protein GrpE n=1 Tax=Marinomonas aquimarina TaxID=295068 RepID=A0A1A8TRE5_9GAMM|nr:nucleotide exchange factor GrpE [Marinomonas aquimarina]SBS36093.1 Protein GrpE [Marinomonas aquimarina]
MSDQTNKAQQEVEQEELLNEADAAIAEEVLEGLADEAADELVKAREEAAQYKEVALRAQAETQNIRRRAEQDVEKAHKFALEKFAKSVITVADNLERALSSAAEGSENDPMREGVELTYRDLVETLARFEVVAVDPAGEPFNPELHQAMTMVPNPNLEPNTVMDVVQKGYTLNGRLLRPAMVVVSSAA